MDKKSIVRCGRCKEVIVDHEASYTCLECGIEFCSFACKEAHRCHDNPGFFVPWEHDNEFVEEDGDELTSTLMDILFRDKKNRDMEKKEGKIKCLICEQVKEGVTDDNPYSVCSECFVELRAEFLKILDYDEEKATDIHEKYKIFKMPDEFQIDKKRLMAILLAKKQYAKRDILHITYKTPSKEGTAIFELYDLKFWEVPEPTILCIMDKIFEFTPGCYLMVSDD